MNFLTLINSVLQNSSKKGKQPHLVSLYILVLWNVHVFYSFQQELSLKQLQNKYLWYFDRNATFLTYSRFLNTWYSFCFDGDSRCQSNIQSSALQPLQCVPCLHLNKNNWRSNPSKWLIFLTFLFEFIGLLIGPHEEFTFDLWSYDLPLQQQIFKQVRFRHPRLAANGWKIRATPSTDFVGAPEFFLQLKNYAGVTQ